MQTFPKDSFLALNLTNHCPSWKTTKAPQHSSYHTVLLVLGNPCAVSAFTAWSVLKTGFFYILLAEVLPRPLPKKNSYIFQENFSDVSASTIPYSRLCTAVKAASFCIKALVQDEWRWSSCFCTNQASGTNISNWLTEVLPLDDKGL